MNYYYLVSSLPELSMHGPPVPLSFAAFADDCGRHLSAADRAGLDDLKRGPEYPTHHPFVREWNECEVLLRNALVHHRAARRHLEAEHYIRPQNSKSPAIEKVASEAFTKPDPLQRERALDHFRWGVAESLAGLNMFAGRAVLAYAVKLRIAERWSTMNEEDGAARAREIASRRPDSESRQEHA